MTKIIDYLTIIIPRFVLYLWISSILFSSYKYDCSNQIYGATNNQLQFITSHQQCNSLYDCALKQCQLFRTTSNAEWIYINYGKSNLTDYPLNSNNILDMNYYLDYNKNMTFGILLVSFLTAGIADVLYLMKTKNTAQPVIISLFASIIFIIYNTNIYPF